MGTLAKEQWWAHLKKSCGGHTYERAVVGTLKKRVVVVLVDTLRKELWWDHLKEQWRIQAHLEKSSGGHT